MSPLKPARSKKMHTSNIRAELDSTFFFTMWPVLFPHSSMTRGYPQYVYCHVHLSSTTLFIFLHFYLQLEHRATPQYRFRAPILKLAYERNIHERNCSRAGLLMCHHPVRRPSSAGLRPNSRSVDTNNHAVSKRRVNELIFSRNLIFSSKREIFRLAIKCSTLQPPSI